MYERFSHTAFQALITAREHVIRTGDPSITERALLVGVVAADPALAEALELDPSSTKDSTLNIGRDIWLVRSARTSPRMQLASSMTTS